MRLKRGKESEVIRYVPIIDDMLLISYSFMPRGLWPSVSSQNAPHGFDTNKRSARFGTSYVLSLQLAGCWLQEEDNGEEENGEEEEDGEEESREEAKGEEKTLKNTSPDLINQPLGRRKHTQFRGRAFLSFTSWPTSFD